MENISIDTLYSLLDKFDTLKELLTKYGTYIVIAAAVFALLNCFFGYVLRKVWSVLLGFGIGASGGMLLATYTEQSYNMVLGVTLGLGLIFGLLALLLYRIGTFFLIIGFLGFSLYRLLNPQDLVMLLFLLGIAVITALIGVPFERVTVILITSVCGALTAVTLAYDIQKTPYDLVMWIIILILAALGMVFQFKPWKGRSYEEEDDDPEEEYRRRRKRRGSSDRSGSRGRSSRRTERKKSRKKGSASRSRSSCGHKTKVSQNTMYDFRFVPEEPEEDTESDYEEDEFEEPVSSRRTPLPSAGTRENSSIRQNPEGGITKPVQERTSSGEPDLSDIRQHISEEVQEIYRDSQNNRPY